MSQTKFNDLYKWVRFAVLRDNNKDVLPEDDIDLALEYLLEFDALFKEFAVEEVNGTGQKQINPELDIDKKKLLILKAAFLILEPQDAFSYRTAVLSKTIEGDPGIIEQKENLKRQIRELELGKGSIAIKADNEINAYLNRADRFTNTVNSAFNHG